MKSLEEPGSCLDLGHPIMQRRARYEEFELRSKLMGMQVDS